MPNYVKNIVKMAGIAAMPLFVETDGKKSFSFNMLIEKPKELDIEAGSSETLALEALLAKILPSVGRCFVDVKPGRSFPTAEALRANAKKIGKTLAELEKLGLQYATNIVKYGAATWYDWCIIRWGTKWDAMETEIIDDDTISFLTAWSDPEPVMHALANRYPEKLIEHWWADEDTGSNAGYRLIEDGMCHEEFYSNGCQEALETYVRCWGMDSVLYRGEDGLLHYCSEEDDDE